MSYMPPSGPPHPPPPGGGYGAPPPGYGYGYGPPGPHLQPSRKDQIMIYAVLGWAVCGIFSFVAYQQANADLFAIENGDMDPRDHGTIKMLKTLSLVHVILMIVSIAASCVIIPLMLASGGFATYY